MEKIYIPDGRISIRFAIFFKQIYEYHGGGVLEYGKNILHKSSEIYQYQGGYHTVSWCKCMNNMGVQGVSWYHTKKINYIRSNNIYVSWGRVSLCKCMNAMGICEYHVCIEYSQRNCINKHFSIFSGDPVRSDLSLNIPQRLTLFESAKQIWLNGKWWSEQIPEHRLLILINILLIFLLNIDLVWKYWFFQYFGYWISIQYSFDFFSLKILIFLSKFCMNILIFLLIFLLIFWLFFFGVHFHGLGHSCLQPFSAQTL